MADGAPAFITFDDDEPPASAAAKPPPPFITFDDADAPAAAEAPAPPSFITFDEPAAAPPTVARGPTTELSVARDPNAPDPWENQPSLFSQLLTQGWQGVAGGATTQGITNLFGIAAADVPLTPGTTSRRPEIEAYFAMPPEQRLAFKVELSKDPSATAQSISSRAITSGGANRTTVP